MNTSLDEAEGFERRLEIGCGVFVHREFGEIDTATPRGGR
jgi:hypothetical protein